MAVRSLNPFVLIAFVAACSAVDAASGAPSADHASSLPPASSLQSLLEKKKDTLSSRVVIESDAQSNTIVNLNQDGGDGTTATFKWGQRESMEGMHSYVYQKIQQRRLRELIREKDEEIADLRSAIEAFNNRLPPPPKTNIASFAAPPFGNDFSPSIPSESDDKIDNIDKHSGKRLTIGAASQQLDLQVRSRALLADFMLDHSQDSQSSSPPQIPDKKSNAAKLRVVYDALRNGEKQSEANNHDNNNNNPSPPSYVSDAKSVFVTVEMSGKCQARLTSSSYLTTEVPDYFNWVYLPSEHFTEVYSAAEDGGRKETRLNVPNDKLYNLVKKLPKGSLSETADYNPKGAKSGKSPGLYMLSVDFNANVDPALISNANREGGDTVTSFSSKVSRSPQPHAYFFVDPRYVHVHDPEKAPQTAEDAKKARAQLKRPQGGEDLEVIDAEDNETDDGHSHHGHHHGPHGTRPLTDTYYVQETGSVDLWVPAGARHLDLYCDDAEPVVTNGNASSSFAVVPAARFVRIPIPSHRESEVAAEAKRRAMATQASGTEYREIHVVGPPDKVLNVVFVSGAYLESGRDSFFSFVRDIYDILIDKEMDNKFTGEMDGPSHDMHASVPHNRYLTFWNVFAVFQPSSEEGPSRPAIGRTTDNNLRCVHPAEMERGLSCNWDLAKALAAVAPVNLEGKPGRTLVITLVNTPIYGGTGQHIFGSRNFCNFFNGYDLSDIQQKQRMISLMNHEIGHALGGLVDEYLAYAGTTEYDRPFANCQKGTGVGNNPPPSTGVRWKWWVDRMLESPSAFLSTYGDRIQSSGWGMLQNPTSECLYKNYYRPSDFCMMYRLTDYAMCPVCREAATVTQMRLGFDLQYPRKPLEDQVIIVLTNTTNKNVLNINSNFTLHLSRVLTAANNFQVTLKDYDGTDVPLMSEDADYCPACFMLRAANFAKYPKEQIVTLEMTITDNTKFVRDPKQRDAVSADQPNQFVQKAKFRLIVTDRDPSTFHYAANDNSNSAKDRGFSTQEAVAIVNVSLVNKGAESEVGTSRHDGITYYAMCDPADGSGAGICSMNFTNNVYNTPTKLDDDLAQYDLWAVAILAVVAVVFFIGWIYQCIANRSRSRGVVRPIFKVEFSIVIRFIRFLMLATAVGLMFASIAALALSAYFYTKLSVLGKLLVYVGLGASVPLYLLAFVGYSAVISRSKRWLMVNGILLLLTLAGACTLLALAESFVAGVKVKDESQTSWMADFWKQQVSDDPEQLCAIQNEIHCTGWNQSCIAVFGVTDECPSNCDVVNNKYAYACGALITDIITEHGPTAIYILSVGVGLLVIGIAFDIITWIALFWMKLAIRNKNKAKIQTQSKATGSSKDLVAEKKYGALLLLMSLGSGDTKQLIREFKRIDKDGSGTLEKVELFVFFKKALCYKATEAEINEIFAIADTDNDRSINLKEFLSLFNSAGGASSDRSTQIIRQRLAERGLINKIEMAHRDAVNKNDHHGPQSPHSPGGGGARANQYSPANNGRPSNGSPTKSNAAAGLQVPMLPPQSSRNSSKQPTPRGAAKPPGKASSSSRPPPMMMDDDMMSFHL